MFTGSDVCENALPASTIVFRTSSVPGKKSKSMLSKKPLVCRKIIRELCRVANTAGREPMIQVLVDKYNITEMLALFPGEPGWELQEGNRIFEMFEKETDEAGIYVTSKGLPNVASRGLRSDDRKLMNMPENQIPKERIRKEIISDFPIYEYAWTETDRLPFDGKVRGSAGASVRCTERAGVRRLSGRSPVP